MARLKTGSRIRSVVCTTEVMVIAAPRDDVEVACGGAPMVGTDEEPPAGLSMSPDSAKGTVLGKRYVNEAGDLELLCIKPGDGSLSVAGGALTLKEAKPLPSSD